MNKAMSNLFFQNSIEHYRPASMNRATNAFIKVMRIIP